MPKVWGGARTETIVLSVLSPKDNGCEEVLIGGGAMGTIAGPMDLVYIIKHFGLDPNVLRRFVLIIDAEEGVRIETTQIVDVPDGGTLDENTWALIKTGMGKPPPQLKPHLHLVGEH